MTRLNLVNRTRVKKQGGRWWVRYSLPYSGTLDVDFATWQEAMDEACQVERSRYWI